MRVTAGSYGDQRSSCKETGWVDYLLDDNAVMARAGPTVSGNYFQRFIGGTITHPVICAVQGSDTNYLWYERNHPKFNERGCWQRLTYFQGHDITLIGPGDIGPNASLCPGAPPDNWIDGAQDLHQGRMPGRSRPFSRATVSAIS